MNKGNMSYFSGRMAGKKTFYQDEFRRLALTMKEGQAIGVFVEGGIAVFEFKGIKRPAKPDIDITFDEMD